VKTIKEKAARLGGNAKTTLSEYLGTPEMRNVRMGGMDCVQIMLAVYLCGKLGPDRDFPRSCCGMLGVVSEEHKRALFSSTSARQLTDWRVIVC
jgi:hypothetical protein